MSVTGPRPLYTITVIYRTACLPVAALQSVICSSSRFCERNLFSLWKKNSFEREGKKPRRWSYKTLFLANLQQLIAYQLWKFFRRRRCDHFWSESSSLFRDWGRGSWHAFHSAVLRRRRFTIPRFHRYKHVDNNNNNKTKKQRTTSDVIIAISCVCYCLNWDREIFSVYVCF